MPVTDRRRFLSGRLPHSQTLREIADRGMLRQVLESAAVLCRFLANAQRPATSSPDLRITSRLTVVAAAVILSYDMETTTTTEPVVQLTESAAGEVKSLLSKPENSGKTLRLYVEKGGCSGMQYSMTFDEKRADDLGAEMHGVSVLVDPFSAQYLRGTVVDFSDSLTGGGFKISNPNATQSCGCGKSFTA